VAAAVVANDDLLAKENAQLSAQGLVDSVAASLAGDSGDAGGQQALLAFGSSSSAASAAIAAAAAALCGDLINNNNNSNNGVGGGGGGGGAASGGGVAGDCATKLEYALMGGQPLAEEPRFVTSAALMFVLVTPFQDDSTVTGTENLNPSIQSAGNPNNPQQTVGGVGGGGLGSVGSAGNELNGAAARNVNVVVEPLCSGDSSDELFRSFSESNFEIESLLSDLATVEVKVENVLS